MYNLHEVLQVQYNMAISKIMCNIYIYIYTVPAGVNLLLTGDFSSSSSSSSNILESPKSINLSEDESDFP